MADWYVYQHDADPLGPWSTDAVAEAILAGRLAPDVWVAAPGGPRWLRALDVPVIGRLVEGIPTRPRRDSGLRLMPGLPPAGQKRHDTAPMVGRPSPEVGAVEPLPTTRPQPEQASAVLAAGLRDEGPPTERTLPPAEPSSSAPSTPTPKAPRAKADDTIETVTTERRRRRKGA